MKVAVVVPAYNVAPYIGQCLQSILNQDYQDLQIIVVDDGSTDDTKKIIEEYAGKDNRIIVISQPNSGQSVARNTALKYVSAPFVTMVDGDDMLLPGIISQWVNALKDNSSCDIALSFFTSNFEKSNKRKHIKLWNNISGKECLLSMLYRKKKFSMSPWGSLMRTELWKGIEFPPGKIYEDLATLWRIFLRSKGVLHTSVPGYYYRKRPDSAMNTFTPARLGILDICEDIVDKLANISPRLHAAAKDRQFSAACNILGHLKRNKMMNTLDAERCWQIICNGRHQVLKDSDSRCRNHIAAFFSLLFGKKLTSYTLSYFV